MERTLSGIGVLDKSVAVLDAVADAPEPPGLAALVAATGLPKPTVHRLIRGLEVHGWLRRDSGGRYHLGSRLVDLARSATPAWPVAEAARPALEVLRRLTGESVQLYVRDGDQRVCVVSLPSDHELRTIVEEGARLPLGRGSAGRILADGFEDTAGAEGWRASAGERAAGVASVSAPVVVDGVMVAAVGISGPLNRLGADAGLRHGPAVVEAASTIATALA